MVWYGMVVEVRCFFIHPLIVRLLTCAYTNYLLLTNNCTYQQFHTDEFLRINQLYSYTFLCILRQFVDLFAPILADLQLHKLGIRRWKPRTPHIL